MTKFNQLNSFDFNSVIHIIKKNKILIILKFNILISVVCFKKKQLIKFNIKLILIIYFNEK